MLKDQGIILNMVLLSDTLLNESKAQFNNSFYKWEFNRLESDLRKFIMPKKTVLVLSLISWFETKNLLTDWIFSENGPSAWETS